MKKRDFDGMVSYFNSQVLSMDINKKHKQEILGMMAAIQMAGHDMKILKWIPVTEALPKDGQAVLCTVKGYPEGENWTITGCRYKDGVWETCEEAAYDYWTELSDVIAWMPLPEPWRCEK